jgi:heme/copper-type cytochrome/quinol oxidase subunit 2
MMGECLQELLRDMMKEDKELRSKYKCSIWTIRIAMNVFVGLLIAGSSILIWFLLRWELGIDDPTTEERTKTMVVPIIITIIMMMAPVLFSWMTRYERLSSPHKIWLPF